MAHSTIKDLLQFAIKEELKAELLYRKYAALVKSSVSKTLLLDMADMEAGHAKRLQQISETNTELLSKSGTVTELHISDFFVKKEINESSNIQDVFVFAMHAEEKA